VRIIDNINTLLGDDLKATLRPKSRLKIAASCFSIYAYEALKSQLSKIESLQFIFTAPAFIAEEATDKVKKERREFFIPKLNRERSLYGSEFEIQLRNKMTQKAIARECAGWLRSKAQFRSNKTTAQMQQFACVESTEQKSVYSPLHGFTAVDLGYQPGNAVSNIMACLVATGDENVLTAQSSDLAYRKEQLRRLQDEVIDLEDVKTGVSITDLGLNDFRMDLLEYVKSHGEPKNVPNGLHAVIAPRPEVGLVPGVIFALRNRHHAVNIDRQNLLHPYYLAYIDEADKLVAKHTQVKKLLDMVRTGCKGHAEPLAEACRAFNKRTGEGRNMKACSALLGEAIRSMIQVKEEKDVESLFTGGKTTALVNTIAGLDDFELIAFIVVQGGQ
jgi:hypothetical protein